MGGAPHRRGCACVTDTQGVCSSHSLDPSPGCRLDSRPSAAFTIVHTCHCVLQKTVVHGSECWLHFCLFKIPLWMGTITYLGQMDVSAVCCFLCVLSPAPSPCVQFSQLHCKARFASKEQVAGRGRETEVSQALKTLDCTHVSSGHRAHHSPLHAFKGMYSTIWGRRQQQATLNLRAFPDEMPQGFAFGLTERCCRCCRCCWLRAEFIPPCMAQFPVLLQALASAHSSFCL